MKFLIWGCNGWIGSMLKDILLTQGHEVICGKSRLNNFSDICYELIAVNPDRVLNTAGITGKPTVDWCEDNKQETFMVNTIGIVNLAHACWLNKYHLTNYATGCIYKYDEEHPLGGKGFTELDAPNFRGSTYSISKSTAEQLLSMYDNVLTLRIRLPFSNDMHPKNIVAKLIKYARVVNIPNSATVLPEMLPISIEMSIDELTGIYNFTNPGTISHNEILELYKKYIDPKFTWINFTEEEQNKILKSQRSNCHLDVSKLTSKYHVNEIHIAVEKLFLYMSDK